MARKRWYAVRCVFQVSGKSGKKKRRAYEERVTLWRARTAERAIERAEAEAKAYAKDLDARYLGVAQSFWLYDEPGDGAEVFSLVRSSGLKADAYVDRFFDTGQEQQRTL